MIETKSNLIPIIESKKQAKKAIFSVTYSFPFGMPMPNRQYSLSSSKYRFGFNGKEMDNEIYGEGNIYDYGFRIYNPQLGKFLSVDPLFRSYSYYTPYQFAGNKPIIAIDLDGAEEFIKTYWYNAAGKVYKTAISYSTDAENLAGLAIHTVHNYVDAKGYNYFTRTSMDILRENPSSMKDKAFVALVKLNNILLKENKLTEKPTTVIAPWMKIAESQLGVQEATNNNDGPEVKKYLATTGLPEGNFWCAAFVNYCVEEAGIEGVKDNPAGALNWRKWGDEIDKPIYGAIATKTRKGGGHVGFVAGRTSDGKIVLLGGNQNDAVSYEAYDEKKLKFNYPSGQEKSSEELPVLNIEEGKLKEN